MGLGPCYCDECFILYEHAPRFECPRCKRNDSRDFIWVNNSLYREELIVKRSKFYKSIPQHVRLFKIHDEMPHTLIRPFMMNDREPNDVYREWLELHVGKQGMNWDWDLTSDLDLLQINFVESEHAVLFELTWPHKQ